MFLLSESQVDRVINERGPIVCCGLILISLALILPPGWKFGGVPGLILIGLAIFAGCYRNWRIEPGIWMLSLLVFLIHSAIWIQLQLEILWNAIAAPPGNPARPFFSWEIARWSLESIINFAVFTYGIRFSAAVTVLNWKRTRLLKQLSSGNVEHDARAISSEMRDNLA